MITEAVISDMPVICQLFEEAIAFQQKHHYAGWKNYDRTFLQRDVEQRLLFKIMNDEKIAGIFSICYADPLIWREKERGDAIYLHRIVANRNVNEGPVFAGILNWAKYVAVQKGLRFIRMDTWAENSKLIDYYRGYGFRFVENFTTANTTALPIQHRNLKVALLELAL
jgi:hypothetical protein